MRRKVASAKALNSRSSIRYPVLTLTISVRNPAMRTILLIVGALFVLAACGTRGPLTLPPKASLVDNSSNSGEAAR
jgi:predicted small lipoprotein YifL